MLFSYDEKYYTIINSIFRTVNCCDRLSHIFGNITLTFLFSRWLIIYARQKLHTYDQLTIALNKDAFKIWRLIPGKHHSWVSMDQSIVSIKTSFGRSTCLLCCAFKVATSHRWYLNLEKIYFSYNLVLGRLISLSFQFKFSIMQRFYLRSISVSKSFYF